ncbi:hypothetical protein EVAR_74544_1 [Eumeta japonica]|uniref:Mariner Mos1 transposase n=1 Tax=Eumeta variegata TaxID=151549 RepID=A0A4C1TCQ1_EUMVA|nr:hypothetical protein EVAR_74544_1 [Eumeta japonica]
MPKDNISAVEFMVETVKRLIYQQIRSSLVVGISQVHKILHQYLAVRLCTRWLSHNLTDAQKLRRINWCREMMQRFANGNSNVVNDMVAGNESWIYCYDPETKRHSAQWPTKRSRSYGVNINVSNLRVDWQKYVGQKAASELAAVTRSPVGRESGRAAGPLMPARRRPSRPLTRADGRLLDEPPAYTRFF